MRYAGTQLADYFDTPDFTGLGKTMMQGNSLQRNSATKAEGMVGMAGIGATAQIKGAGFQADAIEAQGAAQGQASMASGIGSMVSGLAGGISSLGGGGGGGYPMGAQSGGGYGGFGGKYGTFTPPTQTASGNYTFG